MDILFEILDISMEILVSLVIYISVIKITNLSLNIILKYVLLSWNQRREEKEEDDKIIKDNSGITMVKLTKEVHLVFTNINKRYEILPFAGFRPKKKREKNSIEKQLQNLWKEENIT